MSELRRCKHMKPDQSRCKNHFRVKSWDSELYCVHHRPQDKDAHQVGEGSSVKTHKKAPETFQPAPPLLAFYMVILAGVGLIATILSGSGWLLWKAWKAERYVVSIAMCFALLIILPIAASFFGAKLSKIKGGNLRSVDYVENPEDDDEDDDDGLAH